MTQSPVYHCNSIVVDSTLPYLAEEYGLPEDIVSQVVAKYRKTGLADPAEYGETHQEALSSLCGNLSLIVPEAASDIVSNAAHALMGAMAGNQHFIITPEGVCTLNPENMPSIEEAYIALGQAFQLGTLGGVVEEKAAWLQGSLTYEARKHFGEAFDPSQICDQTEKKYNTIYTAEKVYEAFQKKRYNLSFTHHKEAHYAKISQDEEVSQKAKETILKKAETFGLGAKQVRGLCALAKRMDGDTTTIKNIRSKQQAVDLISAVKDLKVNYIIWDDEGWREVHGTSESIPVGRLVIDLKNKTVRRDGGAAEAIEPARKAKGSNAPKKRASRKKK